MAEKIKPKFIERSWWSEKKPSICEFIFEEVD